MTTSNTHIRIRRSNANTAPTALQAGELAYSYLSNVAFIGTSDGLGAVKIGGAAYTAIIDAATDVATANTLVLRDINGSFSANVITANNISLNAGGDINVATVHAGTIYGALGTETGVDAGTWGSATQVPVLDIAANGLITGVTTANISTTLSFTDGDVVESLNLIDGSLSVLGDNGITTVASANTITIGVDDTIMRSNTEGGPQHVSTDVLISGNLTVQGTTTYVDTAINQTSDSMIELAANNTVGDVLDIGFYGKHEGADGTVVTGLVRNAGSSDYYLFDNIGLGDQVDLTSNLITQGAMSANGASLYAYQFLATQGTHTGGFSFSGNEGGLDTGMFSPSDGELQFFSNAQQVSNANTTYIVNYKTTEFESGATVKSGNSLRLNTYDNSDGIYIYNDGASGNSILTFGDVFQERDFFNIQTNSATGGAQINLFQSMDIRDDYTKESLLVKGEQKYGVVTQFLVNGNDPVTQKEIIDPLVPPAVRNMDTVDLGTDHDDAFTEITSFFPWDVTFNGQTYGPTGAGGGIFIGSNGYITFGTGSTNNSHDYPPVATNPGYPAIVVGLGDISYQRVYTYNDGNGHFRVRYEGNNEYSHNHIGGSSSLIWEVVFYQNTPGLFDIRIVRMNGTAHDGTDGRWNTYLTDGTNFLDTRADRTIPWTTYTQFAKQLTNGTNTLELLDDGTVKMPNGTTLSDADSGLFVDSLREDGTSSDIVYYNTTTKELTYGTLADIRADVLSNGVYAWTISGTDGSLTSNVGTSIAASNNSVVIGQNVDLTNSNTNRVAIGNNAANTGQGYGSTAVGENAGTLNQSYLSVAVGLNAGANTQGHSAVAVGHTAGRTYQGNDAVAVGVAAGLNLQGQYATAVGERAGYESQGQYAIAIGSEAGLNVQTQYAVSVGYQAGYDRQADSAVAIGQGAGYTTQAYRAVAVGHYAGYNNQGYKAVAIGKSAGEQNQGQDAVAVGHRAGNSSQSLGGVAIGYHAGDTSQGQYSIAIGYRAGLSGQVQNSIVFDAMNSALSPANAGLYINPIRYVETQDATNDGIAFYNASTKEMTYSYILDGGDF